MLLSTGSNKAIYFAIHFLQKQKERITQAEIRQMFNKACKSHMESPVISKGDKAWGSVSICDESNSIRW
jgi:hypothetical protein